MTKAEFFLDKKRSTGLLLRKIYQKQNSEDFFLQLLYTWQH